MAKARPRVDQGTRADSRRMVPIGDRWKLIVEEFPNDKRLQHELIYALPHNLTELVSSHTSVLDKEDVRFEQRLRELAGTGFLNGVPFGCELLDSPEKGEVSQALFGDVANRFFRSVRLQNEGERARDSDEHWKSRSQIESRTMERLQGYAGWLVVNPVFRGDASRLESAWKKAGRFTSGPPALESLTDLYRPGLNNKDWKMLNAIESQARQFFYKWNLTRMQTWNLPVPVMPVQLMDGELPSFETRSMGATLFVPWSLLADRDVKLMDAVSYQRDLQPLSHLEDWFAEGRTDALGVMRHARMLLQFVYLKCAIEERYPRRLHGNRLKLDLAFRAWLGGPSADGDALKVSADAFRKTREELQKKLNRLAQVGHRRI